MKLQILRIWTWFFKSVILKFVFAIYYSYKHLLGKIIVAESDIEREQLRIVVGVPKGV